MTSDEEEQAQLDRAARMLIVVCLVADFLCLANITASLLLIYVL